MDVFLNIRRFKNDTMVAVCDSNLIGKTFRDGPLCLDINDKFYGTNLVSLKDAIEGIKQGTNVNLVGKHIIKEALNQGLILEGAVIEIAGIPHALIIR